MFFFFTFLFIRFDIFVEESKERGFLLHLDDGEKQTNNLLWIIREKMRGTCLFCSPQSERMIYSIPFRVVARAKLKRNISRFKMDEHQPRESLFCGWFSRLASGHTLFLSFLFFSVFSRFLNSRYALHYGGTCDAARTCERYITQVDGS
jgi:hypothetical protein